MRKILEGKILEKRDRELGVDIEGDSITQSVSGRHKRAHDYELQRRVIEAERAIRKSRLWILALLSAIASIITAITAVIAVAYK